MEKARQRKEFSERKKEKAAAKREARATNKRARATEAAGGAKAPPAKVAKTLDNMREADETTVQADDVEVLADEEDDEFATYFRNEKKPKIMITTRPMPSKKLFPFIAELMGLLGSRAFYYPRKRFNLKDICKWASKHKFTHLMVLGENKGRKKGHCDGMIISHLPEGPTFHFKVSSVELGTNLRHAGNMKNNTGTPELLLNNFTTRLGHRVGRFLGSLFPHEPFFKGRRVVTFHNQRDFIFIRHHRYIFNLPGDVVQRNRVVEDAETRLQEIGPRFCLKLKWIQVGTFDSLHGEYEWIHKRKIVASGAQWKRFVL
jgi:ribosome production factor 1